LELATQLGKKLGRQGRAEITLIDSSRTHIWKPLLHEVAAGTLDSHDDELAYLAQASKNHFRFVLGRMNGLDRKGKKVKLAPLFSVMGGQIMPERNHPYDLLVMAVGSVCNDFGIPGVAGHCMFLDTTEEAEQFQNRLLEAYLRAQAAGSAAVAGFRGWPCHPVFQAVRARPGRLSGSRRFRECPVRQGSGRRTPQPARAGRLSHPARRLCRDYRPRTRIPRSPGEPGEAADGAAQVPGCAVGKHVAAGAIQRCGNPEIIRSR
jgi:hypothetical protein